MVDYFQTTLLPTFQSQGFHHSLPRYYKDKIFSLTDKLKQKNYFETAHKIAYAKGVKEAGSEAEYIRIQNERLKSQLSNGKKLLKIKRQKL